MFFHLESALSRAFWEDFRDAVEIVHEVMQQRQRVAHFSDVDLCDK